MLKTNGKRKKREYGRRAEFKTGQGRAYLDSVHEFQLRRGETAFGAVKNMTGQEAYDLNQQYEIAFMNNKNEGARLWRWFLASTVLIPKGTTLRQRMQRRLELDLAEARV